MAQSMAKWSIQTAVILAFTSSAFGQWVKFLNQTATRLNAVAANGSGDVDEKDFAWGDVDHDGDIDLVSVRKEPFTSAGKRTNVLYMNEGGVLTDRTAQYATATDVPGDNGFLTPTNDRDVVLTDVDGDGWLDIVTAVTLSDGDPKVIGHPRIYRNLGQVGGVWQGFRYEAARIPTMLSVAGQPGNPRFCSVAAGDLTGDGKPELWFGDYDSGPAECATCDFDDRLLLNDGNGFFTDVTNGAGSRFSGTITVLGTPYPFRQSAFGAAAAIADMNGDGKLDIIKQTSLNDPRYVGIAYNKSTQQGFFDQYQVVNTAAPYFFSVGDLNNDGRLDIVVTDDGTDTYLLNTGNAANGSANFSGGTFPTSTNGFGSQSVIADLDNDGWKDVLISDVDVDIPGCDRTADILRNNGNAPNVTFTADSGNIPAANLVGVHNFAVFDINGDGWLDVVIGRCTGIQVWMNDPPVGVQFTYPQGLPANPAPNSPAPFKVQATVIGGSSIQAGSELLFYRVNEGAWASTPMTLTATPGLYDAVLPGAPCASSVEFYVQVTLLNGTTFKGPSGAPAAGVNVATPAYGTSITTENFETGTGGFTVVNDPSLTSGAWQRAIPNGTLNGTVAAAPSGDAEAGTSDVYCFVTENGLPGASAGTNDLDGGPTDLISPAIDLASTDATISYAVWHYCSTAVIDPLNVSISNDGGTNWVTVENIQGTSSTWQTHTFVASDFFPGQTLTSNVRVRFRVSDSPNDSVTESGVDVFQVTKIVCTNNATCNCPADLNSDGDRSGLDIQGFVNCSLGAGSNCACASLDGTPGIQPTDTALFVDAILAGGPCVP